MDRSRDIFIALFPSWSTILSLGSYQKISRKIHNHTIYKGNSTKGIYNSIEWFTPGNRAEFVLHHHMQQVSILLNLIMRSFLVRKINNFTKTLSLRAKVPNTYCAGLYTIYYTVYIVSMPYILYVVYINILYRTIPRSLVPSYPHWGTPYHYGNMSIRLALYILLLYLDLSMRIRLI